MNKVFYILLSILFPIGGCSIDSLTSEAYLDYFEKNSSDFYTSREIGDYIFQLKYTPTEYLVLRDAKADNKILSNSEIKDEIEKRSGLQYYTFRIGLDKNTDFLKYNLKNEQEYSDRIEYYSFIIQENIFLVDEKDTLPCTICHFERNYGLSPFINISVAFKNTNGTSKSFVYNDNILNTGKVVLNINIKELPHLIIE